MTPGCPRAGGSPGSTFGREATAATDRYRLRACVCLRYRSVVAITAQQKAEWLARVPLFSGISSESMTRLAEVAGEVDFPAGSWIVRQGQIGTGLYVILSGNA